MQLLTSRASTAWSQALKKSACIVDAAPEESVTLPEVVVMDNCMFVLRDGTGVEWVLGYHFVPSGFITE